MGRKRSETSESKARIKTIAAELTRAEEVFNALRQYRLATEAWGPAAHALHVADDLRDRLLAMSALAMATADYIDAATKARQFAPAAAHPAMDNACSHAQAYVLEGRRQPFYAEPLEAAITKLMMMSPQERGLAARSIADLAWSAAWSWVSWIEAVDSGRAIELQDLTLADIAAARRQARQQVSGSKWNQRKQDADAVRANRRRVEDAERAWLAQQAPWVIDANERMHAAGIPHAISLTAKPRDLRRKGS